MDTFNIENAVLAAFLYADDMGTDKKDAFILESSAFTSSYRRAVADKINDATGGDKMYGFLSVTLEDQTAGTKFEQEWIDIISQSPLPFTVAKRYHAKLQEAYKQRLLGVNI